MMTLIDIQKARSKYFENGNDLPKTMAVDYENGLELLIDFNRDLVFRSNCDTNIEEMLIEGDREKIKNFLNTMTIFGMKLTVVDMVIV
jgi:hypothetical protein